VADHYALIDAVFYAADGVASVKFAFSKLYVPHYVPIGFKSAC